MEHSKLSFYSGQNNHLDILHGIFDCLNNVANLSTFYFFRLETPYCNASIVNVIVLSGPIFCAHTNASP